MQSYVNGQSRVEVKGSTAGEAAEDLLVQFPALRPHLTNNRGEFRPYVNLFLRGSNIRDVQGWKTLLRDDDELVLVPSIAGG
jgi:sulfur-carrier protein